MKSIEVLGVALLIIGIVILAGYGLYYFSTEEEIPFLIRAAVVAIIIGIVIILLSLIRERLGDLRKERHERRK